MSIRGQISLYDIVEQQEAEIAVLKKALEHECEIAVALTFGRGAGWKMEYETTLGWARCEVARTALERK